MKRASLLELRAIINNAFDDVEEYETDSIEDLFQKELIELTSGDVDTINTFLNSTRSDWKIIQLDVDLRSMQTSFDMYNENIGLGMKVSFKQSILFIHVLPVIVGLR